MTSIRTKKSRSVQSAPKKSSVEAANIAQTPCRAVSRSAEPPTISRPASSTPIHETNELSASPSPRRSAGRRICRNVSSGTTNIPAPTPALKTSAATATGAGEARSASPNVPSASSPAPIGMRPISTLRRESRPAIHAPTAMPIAA